MGRGLKFADAIVVPSPMPCCMTGTASRKLFAAIFAVMTVAALVFMGITWMRLRISIKEIERNRDLLLKWERFHSLLKDAETGQRGFQITGDEDYLRPYKAAETEIMTLVTEITAAHYADIAGPGVLEEVRDLGVQKMSDLIEAIAVRKRDGLEKGREVVVSGRGMKLMDDIRDRVTMITGELNARVSSRSARMRQDLKWGYISAGACGLVAAFSACVCLRLMRQMMAQLQEQGRLSSEREQAVESDRQKSAFLATMSHEIRTPMNAILGFGELLEGEVEAGKQKQHVQAILNGGRSLLQLINDILDLSKIESGMMVTSPEPADVNDIAGFVVQLFSGQASARGVELCLEAQRDLPRSLLLDTVRLRQVLVNLVGNALKFTEQGQVIIRLGGGQNEENASRWRLIIEVEDTGAGIAPDRVAEIFRPFVQGGDQPAAEQKGTGLGLAIVKRLTELMNGCISVESTPGKGSIFRLDFPAIEISARLPQTVTGPEPEVDFNDLQPSYVLAADDNETNRELVKHLFEGTRHRLQLVGNGKEVLEAIRTERPDIVLMDIRMPVMDGRQALTMLRSEPGMELLPVIAVTASSMSSDEAGLKRAFNGFVRKPYSRAELFAELAQFIPRVEKAGHLPQDHPLDAVGRAALTDLVAQLRDWEKSVWPGLRDGMVVNEISEFAGRLRAAAARASCPSLAEYAAKLQSGADSFSVGSLEKTLAEYPGLVTALENRLRE
jgi:signal transduction histidine kinase/CheY-like chemotaxis protein